MTGCGKSQLFFVRERRERSPVLPRWHALLGKILELNYCERMKNAEAYTYKIA